MGLYSINLPIYADTCSFSILQKENHGNHIFYNYIYLLTSLWINETADNQKDEDLHSVDNKYHSYKFYIHLNIILADTQCYITVDVLYTPINQIGFRQIDSIR